MLSPSSGKGKAASRREMLRFLMLPFPYGINGPVAEPNVPSDLDTHVCEVWKGLQICCVDGFVAPLLAMYVFRHEVNNCWSTNCALLIGTKVTCSRLPCEPM